MKNTPETKHEKLFSVKNVACPTNFPSREHQKHPQPSGSRSDSYEIVISHRVYVPRFSWLACQIRRFCPLRLRPSAVSARVTARRALERGEIYIQRARLGERASSHTCINAADSISRFMLFCIMHLLPLHGGIRVWMVVVSSSRDGHFCVSGFSGTGGVECVDVISRNANRSLGNFILRGEPRKCCCITENSSDILTVDTVLIILTLGTEFSNLYIFEWMCCYDFVPTWQWSNIIFRKSSSVSKSGLENWK